MPRNNHNNIRREFKQMLKNFERGQKDDGEYISNWLQFRGIFGDVNWMTLILLHTNVSSRIISRLGKAAKKQGKLISLRDLYWTWMLKSGKVSPYLVRHLKIQSSYHLIEFVDLEDIKK